MMAGMDLDAIEKAYNTAMQGTGTPDYAETTLASLRMMAQNAEVREDIRTFLLLTVDDDADSVVAITPNSVGFIS
jgi:hypothetical protein